MNTIVSLLAQLATPLPYPYYITLDILINLPPVLKARLYIKPDVFVQIYRNDAFDSTSFTLIIANKRVYAKDEVRGVWHRHPKDNPDFHNHSIDGSMPIDLTTFLEEVDEILTGLHIV